MKGFLTGIIGTVRGYTVKAPEMKFTKGGDGVLTIEVGTGGTEKRPATFIDVIVFGKPTERVNEMALDKGVAIEAVGDVRLRKWEYNGKKYQRLECGFLSKLSVQQGGELVAVAVGKDK